MSQAKSIFMWLALAVALCAPIVVAAQSPLLAWRQPIYIVAGFAGVVGLTLLLLQPLLAGGVLPGVPVRRGRLIHRFIGVALVAAVLVHVAGLWLTSPPDIVDALLFASPTPFSIWGVIAMWGIFAAALLAVLRHRLSVRLWRLGHSALVLLVVGTTVLHAVLIDGTMGALTKAVLCLLVLAATLKVLVDLRVWRLLMRRKA